MTTHGRDDEPVLITEAEPSLDEQLAARRNKYLLMMATRIVCLILAAVFYRNPWLLAVFVTGAVALPWAAVLIANDRPPLKPSGFRRLPPGPPEDRAVAGPVNESRPGRVIDQ